MPTTDHRVLSTVQAAVIDMDGVLWRGAQPMPGLTDFFAFLRAADIPFTLATNNASKTPETYVARLASYGVAIGRGEVLTSSLAAADYLRTRHAPGTPVFVVGGEGLRAAVRGAGFALVERTHQPATVVVAGIDFELTYDKLADAAVHIQRGAEFVGTNPDPTYPSEHGLLPGAGTILAAIERCTGVRPVIVGKPEPPMFAMAAARLGLAAARIAMIGDRLDTDILGGHRAGMRTVHLATGVDDAAAVARSSLRPDAAFPGLPELTAAWSAARG